MELSDLGFDGWFAACAANGRQPDRAMARVTAVDRDAFLVRTQDGEWHADLAGKLRFAIQWTVDLPCVGDWVGIQEPSGGGPAIIHEVLPRRTSLRRKSPGKATGFQMIAANIDVAFIVQGCPYDFSVPRLERYLVMVNDGHIEPRVVLSKTDLISPEELARCRDQIRAAGISTPVIPLSNATGVGLDALRDCLSAGRTYCLLGSSGVGKSTLINRLAGREAFATGVVSGTGEGVHTTARRQLLVLASGAMLIDTPGMRELGLLGVNDGMAPTFDDIHEYSARCRFPDCTHTREPGCAVIAARQSGELSEERYQSYLKLRKESEYHDLSYAEKRRKDRAFGRFIKSATKRMTD